MKVLASSIYTAAAAHSTLMSLISGRFYNTVAPNNAGYPRVVFKTVDSASMDAFVTGIEAPEIQFSIFSADPSSVEVEDIAAALKDCFDNTQISMTGYTCFHMIRKFWTLFEDELPNPNGTEWVWHYAIEYEMIVGG